MLSRWYFPSEKNMFSYFADNSWKQFGFISDIIEILYHYELSDYLVEYLLEGRFPPKQLWKSIVYGAVNETHANECIVVIAYIVWQWFHSI
jgi:hypothetical protein